MRGYSTLALAFAIIVALAFGSLAAYKLAVFTAASFVSHWTNFGWTLVIVLFLLVLGFHCAACVRCASAASAWIFFPLLANVFFVFLAVLVLLIVNDSFITNLFATLDPGIVMVANDIYHAIPVGVLLLFYLFFRDTIFYGTRATCTHSSCCCATFTIWSLGGALAALFSIYLLVLDAQNKTVGSVYAPEFMAWHGYVGLVGISLVLNGVVLGTWYACFEVSKPSATPEYDRARAMLKTEPEIFGSRLDEVRAEVHRRVDVLASAAVLSVELERDVDDDDAPRRPAPVVATTIVDGAAAPSSELRRRHKSYFSRV